MLALAGVTAAALVAAYTDMTRGRIPNALVIMLLAFGLTLRANAGASQFLISLAIGAAVFAVGVAFFAFGIIGGGDVKFIAAASAALGWPYALYFILYTLAAGGILGLILAVRRGKLRDVARTLWGFTLPALAGVRPSRPHATAGKMPYALAILAGAVTLGLGKVIALHLRIPL
jgi:prepilin peptidase CpaA